MRVTGRARYISPVCIHVIKVEEQSARILKCEEFDDVGVHTRTQSRNAELVCRGVACRRLQQLQISISKCVQPGAAGSAGAIKGVATVAADECSGSATTPLPGCIPFPNVLAVASPDLRVATY